MRVLTNSQTYFLERVNDETRSVFGITSIDPAAKLIQAKKAIDFEEPEAFSLLRDVGQSIPEGISTFLDAAKQVHFDVKVLKFLLSSASFARKFCDPKKFDPDVYV